MSPDLSFPHIGSPGAPKGTESRTVPATRASAMDWQVGQLLQARLQRHTPTQTELRLDNGLRLISTPPLPIQAGQHVMLKVLDARQPLLEVQLPSLSDPKALMAGMRQSLPRQMDLSQALGQMLQASGPLKADYPALAASIDRLLAALPDARQIATGAGLRSALNMAGLFMESHLRKGEAPASDLKIQLLRLATRLRENPATLQIGQGKSPSSPSTPASAASGSPPAQTPDKPATVPLPSTARLADKLQAYLRSAGTPTPPVKPPTRPAVSSLASGELLLQEVQQSVDGALARIQTQQAKTLLGTNEGNPVLFVEVPFRDEQTLRKLSLRLDREGSAGQEGRMDWNVAFEVDLPVLGMLHARLQWDGQRLNTHLWAERMKTHALLSGHLQDLQARLRQAGFSAGEVQVFAGKPPQPLEPDDPMILDERA